MACPVHRPLDMAEHDGRRVTRVADDGTRTVLAERFQGKRLNSPNDIVVKSDGAIYFTDPPYAVQPSTPGMARPAGWWTATIPGKELPFNGVYRITADGALQLLVDDFALPNGLAFSPDESILYVVTSRSICSKSMARSGALLARPRRNMTNCSWPIGKTIGRPVALWRQFVRVQNRRRAGGLRECELDVAGVFKRS